MDRVDPPDDSTWPSTGPGAAPEPPPVERRASASPGGPIERVIGEHYELREELGRGSMGVVHRAVDRRSGREVAVKLVKDPDEHPERLERFRREALVMAALVHPGILHVLDAGLRPRPYMVTELVSGARTFAEVHSELTRRARVELLRDAARALGFAHARGVVHRDVKPSNLLIDATGQLKVADFGLAGIAGFQPLTRTGSLVGTPLYMSPEQIQGRNREVGPASDVWGIGVALYGTLTNRLPFEGPEFSSLSRSICAARPTPPRAIDPTVAPALERVCLRALRASPARRYADGEALARAIDDALARPDSSPERAWAPLVAGGLAALGVAVWALWPPSAAPPRAPSSATTPPAPSDVVQAVEPPAVVATASTASVDTLAALRAGADRGEAEAMARLGAALTATDPLQSALWLERAAHAGHAGAMYDLALQVERGQGVDVASREAFAWYRRAADLGEPRALSRLGDALRRGLAPVGIARDEAGAVALYRRAAEAGHPPAMNNLGSCYAVGQGVRRDPTEARAWFQRGADAGHAFAMKNLGQLLLHGEGGAKDVAGGLAWTRRSAEAGCAEAMVALGLALLEGAVVERDDRAAAAWAKLAAEAEDPAGMYLYGVCLARGRGVAADPVGAAGWYRRAAERGHAAAMTNYAAALDAGHVPGSERDAAHAWLERAASAGDPGGMVNLGVHLILAHEDHAAAAPWYLRAAEAGQLEGMTNLAGMLRHGLGVPQDLAAAVRWYVRAAEAGSADGMYWLALMLEGGEGVVRDGAAARTLLRRAADAGHPRAMVHLATLLQGDGDPAAARAWLEKAAAAGDVAAREALEALSTGSD
jgi:TPR repeat protein